MTTALSVVDIVTVETAQMSTLRESFQIDRFDFTLFGFETDELNFFLLSQRNPIRKECLFIWVDLVPFWGLSANVGQGEGEGWKVKCSNLGMWRQREENVLSPT